MNVDVNFSLEWRTGSLGYVLRSCLARSDCYVVVGFWRTATLISMVALTTGTRINSALGFPVPYT